jgi:urease accessory protein UreE
LRKKKTPNAPVIQGHLSAALVHLGNICHRVGNKHLVFDGENEKFANNQMANEFLKSSYRDGYIIPDIV